MEQQVEQQSAFLVFKEGSFQHIDKAAFRASEDAMRLRFRNMATGQAPIWAQPPATIKREVSICQKQ